MRFLAWPPGRGFRDRSRLGAAERDTARATRMLEAAVAMSTLDLEQLADAAVAAMADLGYPMAVVCVLDDTGQWLLPLASHGFPDVTKGVRLPFGVGMAGKAMRLRRVIETDDYQGFEDQVPERTMVRGAIAVPVMVDGRPRGVLLGGSDQPGSPPAQLRQVAEIIAKHAATALRNADRFRDEEHEVEKLRQIDLLKEDFIANLTHELRGPLTTVIGLGSTIRDHLGDLPAADVERMADRLVINAGRLDAMIDSLLTLTRVQAGQADLSLEPVALGELVTASVSSVVEDEGGNRALRTELDESATVLADPTLLRHVIDNLLRNALRHTAPDTPIAVTVRRVDDDIVTEVRDEGAGIAADDRDRLTERFYRAEPAPDDDRDLRVVPRVEGLGIGLALAEEVLRSHDSAIEIDSVPGEGSTFRFRLPSHTHGVADAAAAAAARAAGDGTVSPAELR